VETARSLEESGAPMTASPAVRKPHWQVLPGWAKAAALAAALLMAFGGVAYAGILPAPLQHAVAVAALTIGIELPDPGNVDQGHPGNAGAGAGVDQTGTAGQGANQGANQGGTGSGSNDGQPRSAGQDNGNSSGSGDNPVTPSPGPHGSGNGPGRADDSGSGGANGSSPGGGDSQGSNQ
jgi:hypothetical protein